MGVPIATKTVLVVEDNPQNRRLAEAVLAKGGYRVLTAADGRLGLAMARESLPDVIVLDVQMPLMDGLSVTRALKGDPATTRIKIVALTALAMRGDEDRILAAGCDAYLAKPFHYQDLLAQVARLLD